MTWYDDVLDAWRSLGLTVVETPGCRVRSNGGSWTAGLPVASMNHHFVVPYGRAPFLDMMINGHSGLSGPLGNGYLYEDGVYYVISVGPANCSGPGVRDLLNRVRADRPPLGPASQVYGVGSDDYSGGNSAYWNTEVHHPGDATKMPPVQRQALGKVNAGLCRALGWTPARAVMHLNHTARKGDINPGALTLAELQSDTAIELAGRPAAPVIPPLPYFRKDKNMQIAITADARPWVLVDLTGVTYAFQNGDSAKGVMTALKDGQTSRPAVLTPGDFDGLYRAVLARRDSEPSQEDFAQLVKATTDNT